MTLIITSAEVKTEAGLNKNIEDRKLLPWINMAQLDLKSNIGTTGYDAVIAALTTPVAAYTTLIDDYIKPFLAFKVRQIGAVSLFAEADRNGTNKRIGMTYEPVTGKELGMMKADARDLAESYLKLLLDYLTENAATFTWWTAGGCENTSQRPYTGGVITRIDQWQTPYGDGYYPRDGYPTDDGR